MSQQLALSKARVDFRISNATIPDDGGPRCFPLDFTLVANEPFNIDLGLAEMQGFLDRIQTVYIDNYSGTSGLELICVTTGQRIQVQAGKARFVSVLVPQGSFQFTLTATANQSGKIFFINVPIACVENDVVDAGSVVTQLAAILAAVDGLETLVTAQNALLAQPNASARLLTAAASDNATVVKAGAGKLFKIIGKCNSGAAVFLKIYDKASAPVAADTPVFTVQLDPLVNIALDFGGHVFAAGIGYRITGAIADADTTALVAGDVTALNVEYL